MKPEEKAKELLEKFSSLNQWVGGEGNISLGTKMGKQCAIICVEQIINAIDNRLDDAIEATVTGYWKEVKKHFESM